MKRLVLLISLLTILFSCSGKQKHSIEPQNEAELAGLRVSTLTGSIYDIQLSERDDITLQLYNSESDMLQALLNDKTDVVVHDEVIYNAAVQKEYGIKVCHIEDLALPAAFLMRKDERELAATLTSVIRRMEEDGSMKQLKDFWLTDRYTQETSYTHIPDETSGKPILVATATDSSPISFQVNGEWYGIEIDILRELGKELHRPIQIQRYDAGSTILSVQSGKADILCGCIFITAEREEQCLFSTPYHFYHPAYFVLDRESNVADEGVVSSLKSSIQKNFITENRWKYITTGLWKTLKISFLAILIGSLIGVFLFLMSHNRRRWMRSFASVYNGFMAGMPELVMLLILFYVVFAKSFVSPDMVAVITFALFFASGASNVYSTSLDSIPKGQTEAGLALGFTRAQTFFHIIFPQAIRRGLPLYKGQCIALLKGTAIVGYIAIPDLTRAGDIIRSRTFDAVVPLLVITAIYFLLVWLIGLLLKLANPKKKVL